jgi:MFS family permease
MELPEESPRNVASTTPSKWVLFSIVSIALTMASIDQTIVSIALPTIHVELHAPINWTSWVISAYALGLVIAMPLAGRTSDLYGRKQVFIASIILFTLTSLLCGSVTSIYELIPLRTLQALGGGAFLPSAVGIISDAFGEDRDRAIGMTSSILPIGGLIAPGLGGLFIHYWTWRGIFWINVPIGITLLFLALRHIPTSPKKDTASTDFVGVGFLAVTLLGAMAAITILGDGGTALWSWRVLSSLGVALAGFVLLIRRSRRIMTPLIPRGLVAGRGFLVMNLLNFMFGCFLLGLGSLLPLYAEDRYHLGALDAATLLTGRAIGLIALAVAASYVLRRTGHRLLIAVGLMGIFVGTLLLSLAPRGMSPYWWLSLGGLISGGAFGLAAPAINNASLSRAPQHVGAITGLRGLFRQMGTIVGVTVPTAILARSAHPGVALGEVYFVSAVVFALSILTIGRVPEHEGSW